MWTWEDEHQSATLTIPFASAREARWAAQRMPGWRAESVQVATSGTTRFFTIEAFIDAPDSYSDEWNELANDPERYRARTRAALARATTKVERELEHLGLVASAAATLAPEVEACIERTRRDRARAMPPTRRRAREAVSVLAESADGYVLERGRTIEAFCDHLTGERLAPVPLMVGEAYWMNGAEIDVANVDDGSLRALEGATSPFDLRAFLARELQYGPLDVAAATKTLLRAWLEAHDALCLDAGTIAVENSQRVIERTREAGPWTPWSRDARIVVRQPNDAT